MMLGQSVRYLSKLLKRVQKGESIPFPFEYLNSMADTLSIKGRARSVQDCLDLDILDKALQAKACHLIHTTMTAYNASAQPQAVKDNEVF